MELEQAIRERRSIKSYDPSHEIDDATLERIFALVTRSPSSWNLQHWRFVVVRDAARKRALSAAAWGQRHVAECSAVVAVCGKLRAHEDAARTNAHAPQATLDQLVPVIEQSYADDERFQRDEAIRSGSLAAMTLMLVAQGEGLATCPMIGFDQEKVATLLEVPDDHVVVMLVTLGKWTGEPPFPTSRLPLAEVVKHETF
jgi:nitroreductase